jgi:two-component system, cell cycle response regulator
MTPHSSILSELWQRLREPPDGLLMEFGAGGELLVAKLRMALSLSLLLLPLINLLDHSHPVSESIAGLLGVLLAIIAALLLLSFARRSRRYPWLPWATTSYDISVTSFVLVLLAIQEPVAGLNSMVVWAFYLIAIGITALRNDGRLTLFSGFLAVLQYSSIAVAILFFFNSPADLVSSDYGTVHLSDIVQRLLLLVIFTAITAAVVYRMQMLVELSGVDGLTGLPNRTLLMHLTPVLIDEVRRKQGSLSFCLLDVDYFQHVNDQAGTQGGDEVLRHIADFLGNALDEDEHLVRLGGEEFVLLLPYPAGRAWERIEVLRITFATTHFQCSQTGHDFQLTFSTGISSWPHDGATLQHLLRRADLRLRQAKLAGRNRSIARDI